MILAGDIGGTHLRLRLARHDGARLAPLHEAICPLAQHPSLARGQRSAEGAS